MLYIMPEWFWLLIVFIFGLVIGSFLNVVAYRMHTGKSLNGYSHCESCGHRLKWYELFPVVSYLFQLGHCRSCGAYINIRSSLVELATAGVFLLAWWHSVGLVEFFLLTSLLSVLLVGIVYDLVHMIIPDEVSIMIGIVGLCLLISSTPSFDKTFWMSLLAAVLVSGSLALMWQVSSGTWLGLGDAKLAFGLTLAVSYSGAFTFLVLSFWIGALVGLIIIFVQKLGKFWPKKIPIVIGRHVKMGSEIPFAPFLALSFLLVYFYSVDVLSITSYAISLLYVSL